jgi:hypothetical protein
MSKSNPNDISIGNNKWIKFIKLEDHHNAIELDDILKPIEPFLTSLETHCVAECCGIDAYALWPEDIASAAKQSEIPQLSGSIDAVRQRIAQTDGNSFVSHRMNNYFERQTLLQLIDHIAHCVCHADE